MEIKILQVFLGADGLPYKDQGRTVHFPIAGSGFVGASNTTQIKFYFKEIGDDAVQYVAVSKLPNGKVGSKVLENYYDTELDEPYALLELDSYYTQYKGDLFISLQGYQGGVQVTYDEETELYEISGTPTIAATGSIKFTNNYATQFVGSGEEQNITLQQLLAIISDTVLRYNVNSSNTLAEVFNEIGTKICAVDIEGDEYLCEMSGDTNIVLYDIHNQEWYAFTGANTTTIDDVMQDSNKQIIATQEDLENFGNLFTYKGTASVSEINALTDIGNGWCYNLTDSGTLTLGNLSVEQGDNVAFNGTIWTKLSSETVLGNYYTKQEGQAFETQVDNRVDAIENQVQQVAQGSPKGVYTTLSDLQTAYPTGAEGIYVVGADGHWYYWNGTAWTDGGVYLSTSNAVPETRTIAGINLVDDISSQELENVLRFNKDVLNINTVGVVSGYYRNSDTTVYTSTTHKCLKYIPKSKDLTIKYEVLTVSTITKINIEYLDGTVRPLTYGVLGNYEFSFTNVKTIYINFFADESGFTVNVEYEERLSSQVLPATNIPAFSIGNTYNITKKNCTDAGRYTLSGTTIGFIASFPNTFHQCAKISLNNKKYLLSYNKGTTATNLIQVIIEYNDGTIANLLGNANVSNYKIENAKYLYLNFYGGNAGEFVETYTLTDNNNEISGYEDYVDNSYEWANKNCICAGDSISTALDGGTAWSTKFADFTDCNMTNLAISGAYYYGGAVATLLQQLTNFSGNKNEIDYVFLAGGTNDYWFATNLSNFKQAVSDTIDYALLNYPNAKIVVITPIQFNGQSSNIENIQTYRNAITEVAMQKDTNNRIAIVQGYKFNFGKIAGNSYTLAMQYDGVHPTQLGLKTAYLKGLLKVLYKGQ